jgi:oxygen-independent coproporphyrinogen-3 oxidase
MTAAGLYVHVPFCLTRCGYCDFNTYAGLDHLAGRYVEGLRAEASLVADTWAGVPFVSVFFGGGTPTMLSSEILGEVLRSFEERFDISNHAEVTAEANPDTVDERSLAELRHAGVNRVSLGLQSFDPSVLESLERIHTPESAVAAYRAARSTGFDSINLDLIYGANGETLDSWAQTLDRTLALEPDHLSCYALTIEPATTLGRKVAAGLTPPPDPDLQAEMYDLACESLAAAGYLHYEVSNWSRPSQECVHNLGYWEERPYLGLGAGAHSYRDGRRWWNLRPPQQYLAEVEAGRLPVGSEERLSDDEADLERLLLGLRTSSGIPLAWLNGNAARADALVGEGLALSTADRFVLTDRGMFLANDVVLALAEGS